MLQFHEMYVRMMTEVFALAMIAIPVILLALGQDLKFLRILLGG